MAEDKKGFILYADQKELFDQLPNEKAGELIKHIFSYVNDETPITKDLIINLAFTPIKQQLKRDLEKYTVVKDKKSISGREGNLKRWNLDVYNDFKANKISLEDAEIIAKGRKESHTDKVLSQEVANIAVNDTVNVNVKDNDINKINFDKLLVFINSKTKRNFQVINSTIKSKYKARIKDGYSTIDIFNAINNTVLDSFHKDSNFKYLTPEFFSRSTTIDKYSNTDLIESNVTRHGTKDGVQRDLDYMRKLREGVE